MKHADSFILITLLLVTSTLSAMTSETQHLTPPDQKIKQLFEQAISAIVDRQAIQHFKTPRKLRKKKRRISSYTPSSDQEWEIVVAD